MFGSSASYRNRFEKICLIAMLIVVSPSVSFVEYSLPLRAHYASPKPAKVLKFSKSSSARKATANVVVRDWEPGDAKDILDLLRSTEDGNFNPEGSLELDCATEAILKESYDSEDGNCFLLAELFKDGSSEAKLLGTAGLVVGTPVDYYASGASMSSEKVIAAIRRCCCRYVYSSSISSNEVLEVVLQNIEERAVAAGATELTVLAYQPPKDIAVAICKPTPSLLERLGYQKSLEQLKGIDAVQYTKNLVDKNERENLKGYRKTDATDSTKTLVASAIILGLLGTLFGGWIGVAQFMGFDAVLPLATDTTAVNRGLGRPLSSDDVGQLLRDEQLKRKTLDNASHGREWSDLSLEEKREEMALMQVINGQNIRIK